MIKVEHRIAQLLPGLLRLGAIFHTMPRAMFFTHVNFTSVRTQKLCDSGNPPLRKLCQKLYITPKAGQLSAEVSGLYHCQTKIRYGL